MKYHARFTSRPVFSVGLLCLALFSFLAAQRLRSTSAAQMTEAELAPNHPASEAARLYRLKRLPEGEAELPVERYLAADEQMRQMARYSTVTAQLHAATSNLVAGQAAAETWTSLGPGNVGGRTRALIFHPADPQTLFAGAAAGGVWKSSDGGATWRPLGDKLANLAVNALAIDRNQPNVIYAGTGEGFLNSDGVRGAGIFKSTDGGANWVQLPATRTTDFYYVNDLISSPGNGQRLYAATRTGVWRSLDGGGSWTRVLDPQMSGGCLDLAIRTDQAGDYVLASCGTGFFQQSAVYRNPAAAGAGTWEKVLEETGMGRASIAFAPSDQSIVYVASALPLSPGASTQPGLFAVFRSTNGGVANSWTAQVRGTSANKLNTALFTWVREAFAQECGLGPNQFLNTGWYSNSIAVDPLDAQRVWVGGVELFRSDDGGANWGLASASWSERGAPQYTHVHHHVIAFHPQYNGANNRTLFVAGDGGIYKTDDARATTATGASAPCNPNAIALRWTSLNRDYAATQLYHGASYPDGTRYLVGAQGHGFLRGSDAGGINGWEHVLGADGGFVALDAGNSNVIYTATSGSLIRKSTDGGRTFALARNGIDDPGFLSTAPLVMDPSDSRRLWTGGSRLWLTTDGAAHWSFGGALPQGSFSAIAVAPTDSNVILSGTSAGQIFGSAAATPRAGFVSWLAIDPVNPSVAYATYATFGGTHVWRSPNGGATWSGIDGSGAGALPDVPVHCLVIDPLNRNRLFIGTDVGVFVTLDGGANWAVEAGLPNVVTEALVLNREANSLQLFAFTYGRGAWRANLGNNDCRYALTPVSANVKTEGGSGSVTISAPNGCPWTASINASSASWLRLDGNTSGSGNGTVKFTAEPNTGYLPRLGTLQLAGRSFNVTQPVKEDQTPPVVKITGPSASGSFKTTSRTINLSGTVTDDLYVANLNWRNDRGGEGTPLTEVPATWAFNGINLLPGLNQITVSATDLAGHTGSATLSVLYTPTQSVMLVAGNGNYFPTDNSYGDGGPALAASIETSALTVDAQGNLFIVETSRERIRKVAANTGIVTLYAGGGSGLGDGGPATNAMLRNPRSAVADAAGNLYIADYGNQRVRRIAPSGIITTVAGTGTSGFSGDGGPATSAQLFGPTVVALDRAGNLYIADDENRRVRKVTLSTGLITTVAGNGAAGFGGDDGPATSAQFKRIRGLAFDNENNLYIADAENHSVRRVAATTGIITRYAGRANGECCGAQENVPAREAGLREPSVLVCDSAGNLFITESIYGTVRQVAKATGLITTVVGGGFDDAYPGAIPSEARFYDLQAVALGPSGNLFFAERFRVWKVLPFVIDDTVPLRITITSPKVTGSYNTDTGYVGLEGTLSLKPTVTHFTCTSDRGGTSTYSQRVWFRDGKWSCGTLLALGQNRLTATVYDVWGNSASATLIANFNAPDIARTIVGLPGNRGGSSFAFGSFSGDGGPAAAARLSNPSAVVLDAAGNLYIADTGNNRVRKVTPQGLVTTFAGNGLLDKLGDGGPATEAALKEPRGVAVDAVGNLYIADTGQHRIRKVTQAGLISTIAGTGVEGFSGDGGPATNARLNAPLNLAVDAAGNVYFSDFGNHRVRKITASTGLISSVIGGGYGFSGDGGPAVTAQLRAPRGVAVDVTGNLFVADSENRRIRKVTPAGIITTVVGTGEVGAVYYDEPALSAQLTAPSALALDRQGNLYFSDYRVHRVGADGIVRRVAGDNVVSAFGDDGGPPLSLLLFSPPGLALDGSGNLYIADARYHRVVVVTPFQNVATIHAASFANSALASESIVAAFGANLATTTQIATGLPLPTQLGGTSVRVRDSAGAERFAPLFFVSPTQINYQIPPGTANGPATVLVSNGQGAIANGSLLIEPTAPGLFTANATGQGVAAATVLRVRGDGSQSFEPVAVFDTTQNKFIARAINFGAANDQLFLVLFGTGLRQRATLAAVTAQVGGEPVEVLFAGAQGLVGLDQINLALPRLLAGRGEVDVSLSVDGKPANPLRVAFTGGPCSFQVAPPSQTIPATGGSVTLNVTTGAACAWMVHSNAAWLTPASNGVFTSSGSVNVVAVANPDLRPRTAELKLGGQTITITQAGAGGSPSVAITSPAASGTFITSFPTVNLRGTASAASGLSVMSWSNDRGGSGFTVGTPAWAIDNVSLQVGLNNLTVTVYDNLGSSNSARLAVTFQPEFRIQTIAGGGDNLFSEGSRALETRLYVDSITLDAANNVYFGGSGRILKLNAAGILTTVAGGNGYGPGPDNVPATASSMGVTWGLAFDRNGNLYFSDSEYGRVRKIDATTGIVTTVVGGDLTSTTLGDGGPAFQAILRYPAGLAFDSAGNLYIADSGQNRVRKVEAATGIIRTIAGNGTENGALGDGGPATAASLAGPFGLAFDRAGNLFVSSSAGHVRRVDAATGVITTFAGGGQQAGEDIPALTASLSPRGLAFDGQGNLVVTEQRRYVRRISAVTGRIATIAGSSVYGYFGDGGPALLASLDYPQGVAFDRTGNLYITDAGNGRIRKLTPWAMAAQSSNTSNSAARQLLLPKRQSCGITKANGD